MDALEVGVAVDSPNLLHARVKWGQKSVEMALNQPAWRGSRLERLEDLFHRGGVSIITIYGQYS